MDLPPASTRCHREAAMVRGEIVPRESSSSRRDYSAGGAGESTPRTIAHGCSRKRCATNVTRGERGEKRERERERLGGQSSLPMLRGDRAYQEGMPVQHRPLPKMRCQWSHCESVSASSWIHTGASPPLVTSNREPRRETHLQHPRRPSKQHKSQRRRPSRTGSAHRVESPFET